jgi:hypothetical protein
LPASGDLPAAELQPAVGRQRAVLAGTPAASDPLPLVRPEPEVAARAERVQGRLGLDRNPLGDAVVEADEMYQNAGEKGIPHPYDGPLRRPGGMGEPGRPLPIVR